MEAGMSEDLRIALREMGMSQSGFARTLVAWGEKRPFDVVLRWIQRAIASGEVSFHVDLVVRLLRNHANKRKSLRHTLHVLEKGKLQIGRNTGAGWENTTAWSIAETKRQIGVLDEMLRECQFAEALPTIGTQNIDGDALKRFQRIYVAPPSNDGIYLVWDSHRLLPFVSRGSEGTLIEDGVIDVASLDEADLEPIYAALAAAGGGSGIVRASDQAARAIPI
jgi:hypothetical protein